MSKYADEGSAAHALATFGAGLAAGGLGRKGPQAVAPNHKKSRHHTKKGPGRMPYNRGNPVKAKVRHV